MLNKARIKGGLYDYLLLVGMATAIDFGWTMTTHYVVTPENINAVQDSRERNELGKTTSIFEFLTDNNRTIREGKNTWIW